MRLAAIRGSSAGRRRALSPTTLCWVVFCAWLGVGCAHRDPPPLPPADAATFHSSKTHALPLPPGQVEQLLAHAPFEIESMKPAGAGVMGAAHARARFPARRLELDVKWKTAPAGTADGWDNSPRKELAAYDVQQWFLDPDDWIVPPTAIRCIPLDAYERLGKATPTIEGTRCVLGLVAAWLSHVSPPEVLYDPQRFANDPRYAAHFADLNLLTYLIDHRDGRLSNFLVSDDPDDGRVWTVDNGIAFGNLVWNYFVTNWNEIRVPALRRASVERLRRVTPAQLERLLVVAELEADARGVLQPVAPRRPRDVDGGTRVTPGRIQLGLTRDELEGVATRRTELLARVDRGEIPLF
jgi:hypothetical protein